MPNWCENYMKLEVPTKHEADIIDAVLSQNVEVYENFRLANDGYELPIFGDNHMGLLGYLMPEPDYSDRDKDVSEDEPAQTFPDWYSWRCSNWGTKWEVDMQDWHREDNEDGSVTFEFHFDSAWSPPMGVYETISDREGWDIYASYFEGGCAFFGYFEDGEDYCYDIATRHTTEAPEWLVDDYSWHYDYIEECEQDDDAHEVKEGKMTEDQFLEKWGLEVYNNWQDCMKKEVTNE